MNGAAGWAIAFVLLSGFWAGWAWASEQAIPSESGFDGAVRVLERTTENGLVIVTAEIPYRDVRRETRRGLGRIMVRESDLARGVPLPAFVHVHYEMQVEHARIWCEQGWAVATAHYREPEYPIDIAVGNSDNLTRALIKWVRRLPLTDPMRMHLDGGSQGGYMALAMASEFFPITSVTADFPVVNWPYNLNYFEQNKRFIGLEEEDTTDFTKSPLPVLAAVIMLADLSFAQFGDDLRDDSWFNLSPISYVERIASPVLLVTATGDMLVPHEQITRQLPRPPVHPGFPNGFRRAFEDLAPSPRTRITLVDRLPDDMMSIEVVPLQESSFEITLEHFIGEEPEPPAPDTMDLPWCPDHQWCIVILDEGPPTPYAGHTSHKWSISKEGFVEAHRTERAPLRTLHLPLLERLFQRYSNGIEALPTLSDGVRANRFNFEKLERLDVVESLLTYARLSDHHAGRVYYLYNQTMRKPFGDMFSFQALEITRDNLRKELGLQ